jgi:hypothetical protein
MGSKHDSYNFRIRGLQQRVKNLIGASEQQVELWWQTPLPYAPFNLRAPKDLMNDDEWLLVRDWLTENIEGDYNNDIDYYNQSAQYLEKEEKEGVQPVSIVQAVGGIESQFEEWKIHTFTSSGQFYVQTEGIVEYLIVGGGGGGGGWSGSGGGGGGGVVTGKKKVKAGNYNIIVGAGGTAGNDVGDWRNSSNGGNSSAFDITAIGGGAGGCPPNVRITGMPLAGSSGGGGYHINGTWLPGENNSLGAAGTNGVGYKGGDGNSTILCGGGGGGAGGVGGNATPGADGQTGKGGNGGIGVLSSINGQQIYYGGGGGGGAHKLGCFGGDGGLGGGATAPLSGQPGINTGDSPAGAANRGGGGAGASGLSGSFGVNGGAGGSGIVIIRYQAAQGGGGITYGTNVSRYIPAN